MRNSKNWGYLVGILFIFLFISSCSAALTSCTARSDISSAMELKIPVSKAESTQNFDNDVFYIFTGTFLLTILLVFVFFNVARSNIRFNSRFDFESQEPKHIFRRSKTTKWTPETRKDFTRAFTAYGELAEVVCRASLVGKWPMIPTLRNVKAILNLSLHQTQDLSDSGIKKLGPNWVIGGLMLVLGGSFVVFAGRISARFNLTDFEGYQLAVGTSLSGHVIIMLGIVLPTNYFIQDLQETAGYRLQRLPSNLLNLDTNK